MAIVKMGVQDEASEISFDNSTSSLNSTTIQGAIEELLQHTKPFFVVKTENYIAVSGDQLFINTTNIAITITVPSNPLPNNYVDFADYAGTFETNNLTIARNGSKIMGLDEDMIVGTNNIAFRLLYIDSIQGWRII